MGKPSNGRMSRRPTFALLVLFGFTLSACASEGFEDDGAGAVEAASDHGVELGETSQAIHQGMAVSGAGASGQWKGIVRVTIFTPQKNYGCTGTFIAANAILTAAHCVPGNGFYDVEIAAPGRATTINNLQIYRHDQGDSRNHDVALIKLPFSDFWAATQGGDFVLYRGATSKVQLQIYGYGATAMNGTGWGTLRTAPGRTPIQISFHQEQHFEANAHTARVCYGDSGGPAVREVAGAPPVIWGVSSKFDPNGGDSCASGGSDMTWTKVSSHVDWIKQRLPNQCFDVSGQTYTSCW
jgi:hypothetical protein